MNERQSLDVGAVERSALKANVLAEAISQGYLCVLSGDGRLHCCCSTAVSTSEEKLEWLQVRDHSWCK